MIWAAISHRWGCAFLICSVSFFHGTLCDCGLPPVVANTKPIQVTSGTPEENIVYQCDRDAGYYEIPGKGKTSTCQANNLWTPVSDICTRACGVPKRIDFAEPKPKDVESDIFLPNATVSYVCRPGYVRAQGSNIITCLDNFVWSTPEIFCQRKSCGNPGDVENAFMEADDFLFGSRVTYTCNEGFRPESKRTYRDCKADGSWSNSPPHCSAVICTKPEVAPNVEYYQEKDEYSFLDAVTFSCKKPLEVNGPSSVTCTATGQWSSTFPSCVAVECSNPVVKNSRKVSGFVGPYTLNSAISFECKQGFVMQGSSSISCNISSQWEPRIPMCLTVCNNPPTISYALLEESSDYLTYYFDGTTVAYNCKPGFERDPNQNNSVTCSGSTWSTPSKFCLPISCGDPGSIPNSKPSAQNVPVLFGSSVIYVCKEGYAMDSSTDYKKCQADGTWSNPDLACAAVCSVNPLIPFAFLDEVSSNLHPYFNGTVVRYKCKPGYGLVKENTITCIESSWSEPVEFCTRVSCGDPGKIENGHVSSPDFLFGSRATYRCEERFVMNTTENYRECQANGTWTRAIQCTVSCPAPIVPNAKTKSKMESPFVQHDVMKFECEEKFDLQGSHTIKCNSEGQWEPSPPTCVSKDHVNVGLIVGIIAGVIILLATVIGYLVYKHFGQKRRKDQADTPSVQYSHCNP